MSEHFASQVLTRHNYVSDRPSADWPAFNCPADQTVAFLQSLRDNFGYTMLMDITATDAGVDASPRFDVIYHLFHPGTKDYVRIVAPVANDLEPSFPSVCELWPAANWHERECYDMFGIDFTGHPDLRRILMWDGYPFFPLRKDFPLAGHETELPDEDVAEETNAKVLAAPMMGGPFVSPQQAHMSDNEPRARDESWTEDKNKPDHTRN